LLKDNAVCSKRLMKSSYCNLVLVVWHDHAPTREDLNDIAQRVNRFDANVRAFVVEHHKFDELKLCRIWSQPTLSVSFLSLANKKLLPGRVLCGSLLHKHGEYARLDRAGIPVPRWSIISPGVQLDPAVWGSYVVEKPSAGRRGSYVRIRRTTRVKYASPDSFPGDHYGRNGPMLVQRFIYTGEWPSSFRVVTLFGEVLLCYRQTSRLRGLPLKGRWSFRETGGTNIASNTKDMEVELVNDAAVIALAERAHREAFPNFPVLAFDIIRDAETGSLYVLECHAGGTWMFSADAGLGIEAANNLDFRRQFDAIDKAAAILARETPLRAAVCWPIATRSWPGGLHN
jgi:hypothetical protein